MTCKCVAVEVVTCKLVAETYKCIPAMVEMTEVVTCKLVGEVRSICKPAVAAVEDTCKCILVEVATCKLVVEEEACKCIPARVAVANCKYILRYGEEETCEKEAAYA